MKRSVNILKILPPDLPTLLHRPRLHNLLEKNKNKKLILILGQAAQGKTTLAACYVKTSKIPFAWLNLDPSDSEPIALYRLIIQSLQYVLKEVDLSPLLYEFRGTIYPKSMISIFQKVADFISKNVPNPIYLVLDGLDHLSRNPLPFQCLQTLMKNLPPNVHLIMCSRETPPLSFEFQQLKIRQEALVLSNEDLAFTLQEVKDFFHQVKNISLDEDQASKIYHATEGWVGGLILISEYLLRQKEFLKEKDIIRELPETFNKEIFQYFGKEILSSQPKEVQQFLLKSSMMDVIEPHFAKELFEVENTEEILRDHTRKNLFVHSFYDEKRGWLFRYHPMFRNFLKSKYITEATDEERSSLLLKAGSLYEKKGELENAIKYFLEAKAYPQAIPLIERLGMDLLRKGRKSDLTSWMDLLPEDLFQENPWLLLYRAMVKQFMGGQENVISFQNAYRLFQKNNETKGELISLAQLISTSVQTGNHLFSIPPLIKKAEDLLESVEDSAYPYERATLWYCMGQAYLLAEGDIRKGLQACENAYVISKGILDIPLQAYALVSSALGFICVGEFIRAEEAYQKFETLAQKIDPHKELKTMGIMVSCILSLSLGKFEKAHHLSKLLQIEIEKYGFISMAAWVYEVTGYLRLMRQDLIDAKNIGLRYVSTARSLKNSFMIGLALRMLGLTHLQEKDLNKAREVIDQALYALSEEAPSRYHLNRARIISGLICHEIKEIERGERELNEALHYFSSISAHNSLVETHWALAFLKWDQEKREEAVLHLRRGFNIAAKKNYQYFYLFGKYYLARACLLAFELRVEEPADYIAKLLTSSLSPAVEEELKKLSKHSDPAIRKKVWEIRRTIHRSRVPRLRIETLGGFKVFYGDSLIEEREWVRKQPKQLLKAILSHGSSAILKEMLIEDLWPEERIKRAEDNFKTALQRLRVSIEPTMSHEFGSSYLHLHDNKISLDNELCQVDANQFLSLVKKGEKMEKKGNEKESLSFYVEALGIYQGDFLKEDLYSPWVDKKREELRNQYILLLHKTANLYDRQGSFKKAIECYKKVIEVDPLLEESYQKLMMLYSAKDLYNEALRTYEACMKILKKELRTKPDALTMAIYNKILEKSGSILTTKKPNRNRKK
ncbi:MAG: tetratricopeptide repeat protein [Syntrophaceae bacterium]|nr:tetratricopeptide repeat protein [Syntrophaceae bacterium]